MEPIYINNIKLSEVGMLLEPFDKVTDSTLRYPEKNFSYTVDESIIKILMPSFVCVELYRKNISPVDENESVEIRLKKDKPVKCKIADFRFKSDHSKKIVITFEIIKFY